MSSVAEEVEGRWFALCVAVDLDSKTSAKWWDIIRANYQEEQRHYHTLEHLKFMLDCTDNYQNKLNNVREISLAIFFHE